MGEGEAARSAILFRAFFLAFFFLRPGPLTAERRGRLLFVVDLNEIAPVLRCYYSSGARQGYERRCTRLIDVRPAAPMYVRCLAIPWVACAYRVALLENIIFLFLRDERRIEEIICLRE